MVTGQIKSIISVLFCFYLTCATSCISLIVSLKDVTQLAILLFKNIIQEMFLIFDIVEFIEWSISYLDQVSRQRVDRRAIPFPTFFSKYF